MNEPTKYCDECGQLLFPDEDCCPGGVIKLLPCRSRFRTKLQTMGDLEPESLILQCNLKHVVPTGPHATIVHDRLGYPVRVQWSDAEAEPPG